MLAGKFSRGIYSDFKKSSEKQQQKPNSDLFSILLYRSIQKVADQAKDNQYFFFWELRHMLK